MGRREEVARVRRARLAGAAIDPIQEQELYWKALSSGWDALSPDLRRPELGHPFTFLPAEQSPFWIWWSELHPKTRQVITGLEFDSYDAVGMVDPTPSAEGITNPLFENEALAKRREEEGEA